MLDDADYNDFGYYSTDANTPNIDSVARQGVRLSRYYAASGVCSPTRAAMLTGQSPIRYGINRLWPNQPVSAKGDYYFGSRGLPDQDPTIADGLRAAGYRSLHVGKWHIGVGEPRFLPSGKGFDEFNIQTGDPSVGNVRTLNEKGATTPIADWQSKFEADRIISFLEQNRASGKDLFVNWWPVEPHTVAERNGSSFYVPPTFDRAAYDRDKPGNNLDLSSDRGKLLAMLHSFDSQLGRVLEYIRRENLIDDSLVVVTSDNGGMRLALSPTRDVSGFKASLSEGGVRVPFAASWPRRFAAGTHTDLPFNTVDLYPTLLALIGGEVPAGIEGRNLSSVLLNGTGRRPPIFFQMRNVEFRWKEDETFHDAFALVDGCDKIIRDASVTRYFNVCADPGEKTDLSQSNRPRFAELENLMRTNRLRVSRYLQAASLSEPAVLAPNERLNTHQDDLSVYVTASLAGLSAGSHNIYQRGDGIDLRIENGRLVATVTGVVDTSVTPSFRTVTLSAAIPNDGQAHRLGFVIRGFVRGGSSISLSVDGRTAAKLAAPLNVGLDPGSSVLAVKSENVRTNLGSAALSLRDLLVFTTALEPNEI